jgi:hypothetical protein
MKINQIIVLILLCSVLGFAKKKDLGVGVQGTDGWGWAGWSISAKKFLTKTEAVDVGLAFDFEHGSFGADVDYLKHEYKLIPVTVGKLPFFYGVGGFAGYNQWDDFFVGARLPFGVSYEFKAPVDVFLRLTPALRLYKSMIGEIQISLGGRYWF